MCRVGGSTRNVDAGRRVHCRVEGNTTRNDSDGIREQCFRILKFGECGVSWIMRILDRPGVVDKGLLLRRSSLPYSVEDRDSRHVETETLPHYGFEIAFETVLPEEWNVQKPPCDIDSNDG